MKNAITQGKYKVLFQKKVGPNYFKMAICAPRITRQAVPGQFVHLRCQNSPQPLLRRPFSFHRLNKSNFEILYKIVGQGTNLLAKKRKGDTIDILGPLGNGFDVQGTREPTLLVAGGMGVAPLLALAEELADKKDILVLVGARTKNEILCASEFRRLGIQVQLATDDGTQGFRGLVTDLLKKVLKLAISEKREATIYACGPKPMLKEVTRISQRLRICAYGSLEENMACGVGACLGCAVRTKHGYKRVCKDGPVFNLKEIRW